MEKKNSTFRLIKWFYFLLMIGLVAYNVYYVIGPGFNESINTYNHRLGDVENQVIRGDLLDIHGEVLATTQVFDGYSQRYYPYHEMFAHVIGYSELGKAGLEALVNLDLIQSHGNFSQKLLRELSFNQAQGDSVMTTLDAGLQTLAFEALGDQNGAVVAMDPQTGAILAMVSKPSFDPNDILNDWESLRVDMETSPLLNRSTQGLYPPGSTYKILTTAAYLKAHDPDDFFYFCQGTDYFGTRELSCYNEHAHGREGLLEAFTNSCNTAFATMAMSIDYEDMSVVNAAAFFNRDLPSPLPYSNGRFALLPGDSPGVVAETAIGQGETLVSPYQNLLITAAVANDGILMAPYLVDSVVSSDGQVLRQTQAEAHSKLFGREEAGLINTYMISVVENGTGHQAYSDAYVVAGKTGSAEVDEETTHAWFVGYAPADDPQIALAIIVEGGQSGGAAAGPIAKDLFDYYVK